LRAERSNPGATKEILIAAPGLPRRFAPRNETKGLIFKTFVENAVTLKDQLN